MKKSSKERDLGVIVDDSMKFSEQCNVAVKSANSMLGLIRRSIKFKSKDIIVKLYKGLVRPKLVYCVQAWCPYLKGGIKNLEKIQRRATKMINGCKELKYSDTLAVTRLTSLEDRRIKSDLIEVFKMIKGISTVDYRSWFTLEENNRTRGHKYKLMKSRTKSAVR